MRAPLVSFSPPEITKAEISALLNEAVKQKEEERLKRLNELDDRESRACEELRTEILAEIDKEDCRLSTATTAQIVEEMENRDLGAVLVSFPLDEFDFDNISGNVHIDFSDNLSESEVHKLLLALGVMAMNKGRGS